MPGDKKLSPGSLLAYKVRHHPSVPLIVIVLAADPSGITIFYPGIHRTLDFSHLYVKDSFDVIKY